MRIDFDTKILAELVRDIPDFPKPGVTFKDITPLLADPTAFSSAVDAITVAYGRGTIDKVVGMEARGFIIAAPVAYHIDAGFVPLRKPGKLPHTTHAQPYVLEYGEESLEVHTDAFAQGDRVLVVDDVLATGGTADAACQLVERAGGVVAGLAFIIELEFLSGAVKIERYPHVSLLRY